MVAPRFCQFPKTAVWKGWTTENEEMHFSLIRFERRDQKTEAKCGCAHFGGYDSLWKYCIWKNSIRKSGGRDFRKFNNFRGGGHFLKVLGRSLPGGQNVPIPRGSIFNLSRAPQLPYIKYFIKYCNLYQSHRILPYI